MFAAFKKVLPALVIEHIGVARALAQNETQRVSAELETLRQNIAAQPGMLRAGRTFNGTRHFHQHRAQAGAAPRAAAAIFCRSGAQEKQGGDIGGAGNIRKNFHLQKQRRPFVAHNCGVLLFGAKPAAAVFAKWRGFLVANMAGGSCRKNGMRIPRRCPLHEFPCE